MKLIGGRFSLFSAVLVGATMAIAACVEGPAQPPTPMTASSSVPSLGKSTTAPVCENLVYPISLCYPFTTPEGEPGQRQLLCSALRTGSPTFAHPVNASPATQVFEKTYAKDKVTVTGSRETVTIPRPYPYPPRVLYFTITTAQIESEGMCLGVTA